MTKDAAIEASLLGLCYLNIGNNDYLALTRYGPYRIEGEMARPVTMTWRQSQSEKWIPLRASTPFYSTVQRAMAAEEASFPHKGEEPDCGERRRSA